MADGETLLREVRNAYAGLFRHVRPRRSNVLLLCLWRGEEEKVFPKVCEKDKIEAIACFMLSECLKDTELLASLAVDVAAYYQKEHEDKGYIEGLKAERAEAEKALNNLVRAIEQGIFSETTQTRLLELEGRKKALTEAIEAEEIKRAVTKNEISIQHFFDEYKNADLNDLAVRDYLLDYFVDKIFVYDDKVVLTAWYGDDKKEITWGDIDCVVVKDRKRKKRSSASGSGPPSETERKNYGILLFRSFFFLQLFQK